MSKRDKSVVAVVSGLTDAEAANIVRDFTRAKQKNAPHARGTCASGLSSNVGSLIQKGQKKIGGR